MDTENMTKAPLLIKSICIYCDGAGPFSDEHVVCAGLGGDDKRFLLVNVVCARCNTDIFSPLELEALRSSPLAIARSFMQPTGRKRGKRTSPPKLDAQSKLMINKDGYPYEIDFGQHSKPIILPQLMVLGEKEVQKTAENIDDLIAFEKSLSHLLEMPTLCCVRKLSTEDGLPFEVYTTIRSGNTFTLSGHPERLAKPPVDAIWLEEPRGQDERAPRPLANIFRPQRGGTALRLEGMTLETALGFYRLVTQQIALTNMVESEIVNPLVSVSMTVRVGVMERVIAKVGLNLLAYYLGADYLRHSAFATTKQAILKGSPLLNLVNVDNQQVAAILDCAPVNHHCFVLSAITIPMGEYTLIMISKLYGLCTLISLGSGMPPADRELPLIVTADYINHKVRLWSLTEFAEQMHIRNIVR